MKDGNKSKINAEKIRGVIARVLLIAVACAGIAYAADAANDTSTDATRKLQNGSFEKGQTWEGKYKTQSQDAVPSWNTTAYDKQIELFRECADTYVKNDNGAWAKLTPTDEYYAAELNANEESTLYQNVSTTPSSVYEWGLDHGARNGTDIMALVIGPKQSVAPSKPSKAGRDQFMQMVDWLNSDKNPTTKNEISGIESGIEPKQYTVYSKKFAASGAFEDNAGNNAFSLTPSTIYTEEWHIWIMASDRAKTETVNPWNSYGSNAEGSAGEDNSSGSTTVDLSKYYLYTVPAGQTDTVFGFVSVGYINSPTTADKAKTYGNFLDNINFQLYHSLSGSSSNHGSAVIGGSDGSSGGEGESGSDGHQITIDKNLKTYVIDGQPLKIQAIVKKTGTDTNGAPLYDGCEFVGIYYTTQDENGDPKTEFLRLAGNEIEYKDDLTDEQKKGKWIKSTNADGDIIYTYYLENITSATDLHFVFIKSPTITYDPNGGKEYVVERTYNKDEAKNVYSFRPASGHNEAQAGTGTIFIDPYVSKAAEGQNDGWKFLGWKLTGDTVDNVPTDKQVNAGELGSLILPAEHTVACDYSFQGVNSDTKAQYFKIYNRKETLEKNITTVNGMDVGVEWQGADKGRGITYANVHKGLTLVAQWRWLQAFIPQKHNAQTDQYENSADGGTVEITSVTDTSDENYNAAYNANGGKSYHAETDEIITVKATANAGYTFKGWYDAAGNLVTTNTEYTYIVTKESVNTYYARFSNSVTQTYIRQVGSGDTWTDTEDDSIGTLGRYSYTDAVGTPISSTATEGASYKFVGWYDADGNKVADSMLTNNGTTISYITTKDATYYARFQTAYTVKFDAQTKQADGTFKTDEVGGKVSATSVKDIEGATASSTATKNSGYKFLGWYDKNGNQLTTSATYSPKITTTNNVTYYARFEIVYNPTVESKTYLSFIAESESTSIPSAFDGRDAGTGKNAEGYGLDRKFGNTISTGFKYTINTVDMSAVKTIQITVTVPDTAYVKVGGTSNFKGDGNSILTDGAGVEYNKGSIQKINGATSLNYYWDATGIEANKEYGFVIDNLYAPGATAEITVNGTAGTHVTEDNGVVNKTKDDYKKKSKYAEFFEKLWNWIIK